jgi:hypothetical protein
MKKLPLKYWDLNTEIDCLLFFAQRTAEILFDYTLDSFKFPALNSSSIVEEAIDIISKIENNEMPEKSIEPIIEELKWKVSKDKITKLLVPDCLDDYLSLDVTNLSDVKTRLELLYNKIKPHIYIEKCFEVLRELIIENKKKKEINKIIPNLITALIDFGYSQGFLHLQTFKFFFYREQNSPRISKAENIDDFFKIFTLEPAEFTVIFKGSELFSEVKDSSKSFNLEIIDKLSPKTKAKSEQFFISRKNEKEVFIKCKDIVALEPLGAMQYAERRINNLSKLFTYFHHKKQLTWFKSALVYDPKTDEYLGKVSNQTSAMHKCFDLYPRKAVEKLNLLISNFGLESKSFFRFDKAVELHSISLTSQYSENQLLQNWIAFETLLVGYSAESKINQVLVSLIPALKLNYLSRVIATLTDDLMRWDKLKTKEWLDKIEDCDSYLEKTAALISIESNKAIRELFYAALQDFPLLKFRIMDLKELFESPKKIFLYYSFHEQKLIWQLKRIYRTRNLIVHTGHVPDYTDVLIENSHNYLDLLLNQLIDLVIEGKAVSNIKHGIKEIQILQQKHEKYMKDEQENNISKSNYKRLIFGYSTFANTWYS